MNNVKSFSFYRNYYEIIKYLSDEDRLKLYDAMVEYIFEDKEPELENLLKGIWINLKMPLDTSKNNAGRGGRPKKEDVKTKVEKKPIKNRIKTEKKTNNISYFLFLISNNKYKYIILDSNIYNKIYEWLEYKEQRKEKYTEIGLKSLLTQIEKKIDIYNEETICDLIDECMSNNYKGIIFEKLEKRKNQETYFYNKKEKDVPNWFDKDLDKEEIDDKEFDKLLEEMESE